MICFCVVQKQKGVAGAMIEAKDRMEITGARWGLEGGEAVLKLRALVINGDFDAYWTFQIPSDLVVKSQPIDIAEVIFQHIMRPNVL